MRQIHGGKGDEVYASFDDSFRKVLSLEVFHNVNETTRARVGTLIDASCVSEPELDGKERLSTRVAAFFERGAVNYHFWFNQDLRVVSALATPVSDACFQSLLGDADQSVGPADDYIAKRVYALPARGVWHVVRSKHAGNRQQWYGFDLNQIGANGISHKGDGGKRDDFLAFGQTIRAPSEGVVVTIVDGVPDNAPMEENAYSVFGNYIVIDHGSGEYSVIGHVEPGSFLVKVGAHVGTGDALGSVGASGNTSEPHIHWHLASDARVERGHGLPIRFGPLVVNGSRVETPSPGRGDTVEPAP